MHEAPALWQHHGCGLMLRRPTALQGASRIQQRMFAVKSVVSGDTLPEPGPIHACNVHLEGETQTLERFLNSTTN